MSGARPQASDALAGRSRSGRDARGMGRRPGSSCPEPVPRLPAVHLARDHADQVVARQVRTGSWARLTRGAYLLEPSSLTPRGRALARILAVDERLVSPHWFSHESAALIWGLPTWRTPDVTHVRQQGRPSARRDRGVLRHAGELDERRRATVGTLPVTDLEQTMVDCARSLPPVAGLVVADAALRAGADRATALGIVESVKGRNGTARARAVIEAADDGAESPGETASRLAVLRAGLPRPDTQIRVDTRLGTFWADLGWGDWSVLLEYDGRTKYLSVDDLVREKRRQDALVDAGYRVLRVTKEDLRRPDDLAARVRRSLPPDVALVPRPLLRG